MKKRFIYSAIMALAVATGCIKEQGEEAYLITRNDVRTKGADTIPKTIVTGEGAFMYGEAAADTIVANTFDVIINNKNKVETLDCFLKLYSKYQKLDLDRNAITDVGYVYSHTNQSPTVDGTNCVVMSNKKYMKTSEVDSTKDEFSFTGECHNLDFNTAYYIRSFVVSTKGDTIYNYKTLRVSTNLPHNVWFQRKDAPTTFGGRQNCFCCTYKDDVYVYGGKAGSKFYSDLWKYDKVNDTWTQLATCPSSANGAYNQTEKANGAMFAYPCQAHDDVLLYMVGGEIQGGEPVNTTVYYSTKSGKYCQEGDHPNYGKEIDARDENGKIIYYYKKGDETLYTTDGTISGAVKIGATVSISNGVAGIYPKVNNADNPLGGLKGCVAFTLEFADKTEYYIAYGKNSKGVSPQIFRYNVEDDGAMPHYSISSDGKSLNQTTEEGFPWMEVQTSQKDRATEGLYQPICQICDKRVIVGTGESSLPGVGYSKKFYLITSTSKSQDEVNVEEVTSAPDEFDARANAASFYLNYSKDGENFEKLYVGTGRKGVEGASDPDLLNDLWAYDFMTGEWLKCADCSNIYREGAVGFSITRNDDLFSTEYEENARGIFSFGRGRVVGEAEFKYRNDTWEYLP
ncbi:MAG: hypothetical protein IKR41_08710 [Bacteroidales bacterium]|nr:hypothetical protein [Bacteroidales bacterium]